MGVKDWGGDYSEKGCNSEEQYSRSLHCPSLNTSIVGETIIFDYFELATSKNAH
jgi:hypothetical protein